MNIRFLHYLRPENNNISVILTIFHVLLINDSNDKMLFEIMPAGCRIKQRC